MSVALFTGSQFSHTFQPLTGTVALRLSGWNPTQFPVGEQKAKAWQGTLSHVPGWGSFDLGSESAKVLSGPGNRMEKKDWV